MTARVLTTLLLSFAVGTAVAANGSATGSKSAPTLTVNDSVTIGAAPDIVWSTVRDYDAPSVWDPSITSTTLTHGKNNSPGARRHMTTDEGATIDDTLTAWNAHKREFATRTIHPALPVRHYRQRIRVEPTRSGARLLWQASFQAAPDTDPAKAREAVKHRIHRALLHVKHMLGTNNNPSAVPSAPSDKTADNSGL
ncbi:SRPBCC family protein [Salinisphaera hydrothermalis]|uniref:SRPBCC family protein n=1 Tax=Salinisphaera hydrothermalis TaxID=563188 RepID=UPI00334223F9